MTDRTVRTRHAVPVEPRLSRDGGSAAVTSVDGASREGLQQLALGAIPEEVGQTRCTAARPAGPRGPVGERPPPAGGYPAEGSDG